MSRHPQSGWHRSESCPAHSVSSVKREPLQPQQQQSPVCADPRAPERQASTGIILSPNLRKLSAFDRRHAGQLIQHTALRPAAERKAAGSAATTDGDQCQLRVGSRHATTAQNDSTHAKQVMSMSFLTFAVQKFSPVECACRDRSDGSPARPPARSGSAPDCGTDAMRSSMRDRAGSGER